MNYFIKTIIIINYRDMKIRQIIENLSHIAIESDAHLLIIINVVLRNVLKYL